MLKIRLQRTGRRNRPAYRIVVCEHTSPVKGKFMEKVGFYDPILKECKYDEERIQHWISVGAKPSDTVASLLERKGKLEQKSRKRVGKRQKEKLEALAQEKEAAAKAEAEAKLAAKAEAEEAKAAKAEAEEAKAAKAEAKEEAPVVAETPVETKEEKKEEASEKPKEDK